MRDYFLQPSDPSLQLGVGSVESIEAPVSIGGHNNF